MMLSLGRSGYALPSFNKEWNDESKYFDKEKPIKIKIRFNIEDSIQKLPDEVKNYSFKDENGEEVLEISLEKERNKDGLFCIGSKDVAYPEYVKKPKYLYFNSILVDTIRSFGETINSDSYSLFQQVLSLMIKVFSDQKSKEIEQIDDQFFSHYFCIMLTEWFNQKIILNKTFDGFKKVIFKHKEVIERSEVKSDGLLKKLKVLVDDESNQQEINLKGMGIQSMFLINLMLEAKMFFRIPPIICIDEPELHLHPQAQRRFSSLLDQFSLTNQFIITTHSPVFITQKDIPHLTLLKKTKFTTAHQIKDKHILNENLIKTGLESNLEMFFADAVMLVEGNTDKIFFSHIGNKCLLLEHNFDKNNISVIPMGGKKSARAYLKILNELEIPYFVLLDDDGEKDLEELKKFNNFGEGENENLVFLKKGKIENYYSKKLIEEIKYEDALKKLNERISPSNTMRACKNMILAHHYRFPNKEKSETIKAVSKKLSGCLFPYKEQKRTRRNRKKLCYKNSN